MGLPGLGLSGSGDGLGWRFDRLPALAADLVRRRVGVIFASGPAAALTAKAATMTIPIVFSTGGDPVALGLVASLNRPGANVTGSTTLQRELAPKRLQLLRELIPNAALFGVLADPAYPDIQSTIADLKAAARTLGLQLVVLDARTEGDFEAVFTTFSQRRVGGVVVGSPRYTRRDATSSGGPPVTLSRYDKNLRIVARS
jgi:putative tryptophan/tyrosine transport system substrate-binding protein